MEIPARVLSDIIQHVTDPNTRLSTTLREARVLSSRMVLDDLEQWLIHELSGYPTDVEIPRYRHLVSRVLGTYSGPFHQRISNYQLPVSHMPDFLQENASELILPNPLREIESMASGAEDQLRHPWLPEAVLLMRDGMKLSGGFELIEAYQPITKHQLEGILDAVGNRLLELLLGIEKLARAMPAGSDDLANIPKEEAQRIVQITVYGDALVAGEIQGGAVQQMLKGERMSVEIAGLVISGISALASVVEAWRSAQKIGEKLTPKQIDDADLPLPGVEASELGRVINEGILNTILANIETARGRLKEALKDPSNSNQAKDHEVKIAAATICAELARIRQLNAGVLPSKELKELWISHNCGTS